VPDERLFAHPLHEVFSAARRAIQEEAAAIPCKSADDAYLIRRILEAHAVALPEFDVKAIAADLDDQGEYATYVHEIKNPQAFHCQPTSAGTIEHAYEVHLTEDRMTLKFRAHLQPGATRHIHEQIAGVIARNVAKLREEIPSRNASLEPVAAAAVEQRKQFCEELERRRRDLL